LFLSQKHQTFREKGRTWKKSIYVKKINEKNIRHKRDMRGQTDERKVQKRKVKRKHKDKKEKQKDWVEEYSSSLSRISWWDIPENSEKYSADVCDFSKKYWSSSTNCHYNKKPYRHKISLRDRGEIFFFMVRNEKEGFFWCGLKGKGVIWKQTRLFWNGFFNRIQKII
jgi:hypothetical protein